MNSPSPQEVRITRYLLGECTEQEATTVQQELANDPAAAAFAHQIEETIGSLRSGATVSSLQLSIEQRTAILQPASPRARFITAADAGFVPKPKKSLFRRTASTVLKAAAATALCGGAFLLGKHVNVDQTAGTIATIPVDKGTDPTETRNDVAEQANPVDSKPSIQPTQAETSPKVAVEAQSEKGTNPTAPAPQPTPPAASEPQMVASATSPKAEKPSKADVQARTFTTAPTGFAFTNASRMPDSRSVLRPSLIRPAPIKTKGEAFAKPVDPGPREQQASKAKKQSTPPIYVHSWKSEVAPCPWNPQNRLLRVTIQIPAKQPAAESADFAYAAKMKFDAHHVRDYRLLCERHTVATELDRAGLHVLWYEFSPNGAPAKFGSVHDKPVATLSLPGVKFTSKAVGPFDETHLLVEDPGIPWAKARDDFAFESSVVGFGLLLRGVEDTGDLDHQLVLKLAKEARGTASHHERDRFIRLVEDAKRTAGL